MPKLLIHSLSEFREVILGVLDAAAPTHIVEVGSESGGFSAELVKWARAHGATLTTIDPMPAEAVHALAAANADVQRLLLAKSPAALADLAPAQAYVIDGDHNYSVVSRELAQVAGRAERSGEPAVALMHDVCWPAGRRDLYYAPGDLPAGDVHPHTFDRGLDLDSPDTVEGGFRGEGNYAAALREGGPRNGVLTAIEDFMVAHPGWELYVVPAVFGLGVLVPVTHPRHDAIVAAVRAHDRDPLLARLEENRLRNYLHVLQLQDQERSIVAHRDAVVADRDTLRETIAAMAAHAEALRADLTALRAECDALRADGDVLRADRDARRDAAHALEQKLAALEARWYARLGGGIERRLAPLTRRGR